MSDRRGIIAVGTYLPSHRLERSLISRVLGSSAGDGQRTVASYDEDTTTLGVEAARTALAPMSAQSSRALSSVTLSTSMPAYADKTNAAAIHAALGLPQSTGAYDMVGSIRSGIGALRAAISGDDPTLAVLSDIRTGLPGSSDESDGGDGAAALVCGPDLPGSPVIAELVGSARATVEILDQWRLPGERDRRHWDERFVQHVYSPMVSRAVAEALDSSELSAPQIDHLAVTGTLPRAATALRRSGEFPPESWVDDLASRVGNTGTAHPGILLSSVLERATPGDLVLLVVIADGVDALVFRCTDAIETWLPALTVEQQIEAPRHEVSYEDFLVWRDMLKRASPRRPSPAPPSAPPALRSSDWKFGFAGSRCLDCGAVQLPPARVCANCRSVDRMETAPVVDHQGVVATFAIDRLAHSLGHPLTTAVLDFDGGGRFECEVTGVEPDSLQIGDRMEMTFRRLFTVDGIHNYFWKARPVREIVR